MTDQALRKCLVGLAPSGGALTRDRNPSRLPATVYNGAAILQGARTTKLVPHFETSGINFLRDGYGRGQ